MPRENISLYGPSRSFSPSSLRSLL